MKIAKLIFVVIAVLIPTAGYLNEKAINTFEPNIERSFCHGLSKLLEGLDKNRKPILVGTDFKTRYLEKRFLEFNQLYNEICINDLQICDTVEYFLHETERIKLITNDKNITKAERFWQKTLDRCEIKGGI